MRRDHAHSSVESSCSIRPACRTRRYAGDGGGAGAVHSDRRERVSGRPGHPSNAVSTSWYVHSGSPEGQLLHINSFCGVSAGCSPRLRHGQRVTLSRDIAIGNRVRTTAQ